MMTPASRTCKVCQYGQTQQPHLRVSLNVVLRRHLAYPLYCRSFPPSCYPRSYLESESMVGHLDMTLVLLTILSIAIPSTTQTTKSSNELYSWSYWGEGDLDKFDLGYQPLLEACGNGSCGNCLGYNGSVPEPCDGHTLHNSCFKPYLGETCCKDNSGTACMYGYHCAYDVNNDGFCCADVCISCILLVYLD
ncbi:hypothetical protein BU24DRAFT_66499 [Aaosphaeria arxii CBS 175.79]|uniref:Uncharacterized protein n=1 Tax=Aaosphaeria arxii CBS 175.79 TaxID=1450172 RepID=A0A6A5XAE4_9PLEO|nr:uncharacterized protein BU24DRAFT_66499 [Aaosphaeria arxii CBS 175.79]KAF2009879.1 hypothetical protein BU24DRAFT_66499 [Aaosphaeria arxii CBS 175.79]